MADAIPAKLRQPDITRFLNRANQLREFKPAMAYWCDYSAVLRIMRSQLHTTDDAAYRFTTALMDRLEAVKQAHPDDDTITDDTAGQAFVEQFAQETLDRAERVVRAGRVTRKTADTFDAAATFWMVVAVWTEIESGGEVAGKIKYAKWNAARILRDLREGRDPNESNPKGREEEALGLDMDDPEVRAVMGDAVDRNVKVEEVQDQGEPVASPPGASSHGYGVGGTAASGPRAVSPNVSEGSHRPASRDYQAARGYFDPPETFAPSPLSTSPGPPPSAPQLAPQQVSPGITAEPQPYAPPPPPPPPPPPQAAAAVPAPSFSPPAEPSEPWGQPSGMSAGASAPPPLLDFPPPSNLSPANPPSWTSSPLPPATTSFPAPTSSLPTSSPLPAQTSAFPPPTSPLPTLSSLPPKSSLPPVSPPQDARRSAMPPPPAPAVRSVGGGVGGGYSSNQKDISAAQKHAKWAISALNFEDVSTAVQELRNALSALNAS